MVKKRTLILVVCISVITPNLGCVSSKPFAWTKKSDQPTAAEVYAQHAIGNGGMPADRLAALVNSPDQPSGASGVKSGGCSAACCH